MQGGALCGTIWRAGKRGGSLLRWVKKCIPRFPSWRLVFTEIGVHGVGVHGVGVHGEMFTGRLVFTRRGVDVSIETMLFSSGEVGWYC